jgi:small nuclear ribonucleoprotein (snRNP)-like protein
MNAQRQRHNPADFVNQLLGRPVEVKTNDSSAFRGTLKCLDGTMNILLTDVKETQG